MASPGGARTATGLSEAGAHAVACPPASGPLTYEGAHVLEQPGGSLDLTRAHNRTHMRQALERTEPPAAEVEAIELDIIGLDPLDQRQHQAYEQR